MGYKSCACRDCFEIAIGNDGEPTLCWECDEAGCDVNGDEDCQAPGAYDEAEWEADDA